MQLQTEFLRNQFGIATEQSKQIQAPANSKLVDLK